MLWLCFQCTVRTPFFFLFLIVFFLLFFCFGILLLHLTFCLLFFIVVSRRCNTHHGRTHKVLAPVQWRAPQALYAKYSPGIGYYISSASNVETLVGLLGFHHTMFWGMDLKAKLGLGYITVNTRSFVSAFVFFFWLPY